MAFIAVATDNFNDLAAEEGTDGRVLAGASYEWKDEPNGAAGMVGDGSGRVKGFGAAASGFSLIYESGGAAPAWFTAPAVEIDVVSEGVREIWFLAETPDGNQKPLVYRVQITPTNHAIKLFLDASAGATTLVTSASSAWSAGDTVRAECVPGAISIKVNGGEVISWTTPELLGPFVVGLYINTNADTLDNFVLERDSAYAYSSPDGYVEHHFDDVHGIANGVALDGQAFLRGGAASWGQWGALARLTADAFGNYKGPGTDGYALIFGTGGLVEGAIEANAGATGTVLRFYHLSKVLPVVSSDGYQVDIYPTGHANGVKLYRRTAGASTQIGSVGAQTWKAGDRWTLVFGNAVQKVYRNDVLILSTTDATHSNPYAVLVSSNATAGVWHNLRILGAGINVSGADALEFSEVGEKYTIAVSKGETVDLGEAASEIAILNVGAPAEGVEFGEFASLTHDVEASDALEFDESAVRVYTVAGADQVDFDEEATRDHFALEQVLFGESGSAVKVVLVVASDGIEFVEGGAYLPIEGCETSFVPSPPIQADPADVTSVYLLGPWATMVYSIRLPRPAFGDLRRNRFQVITHRTRGGQRRVYKRTPSYRSLVLTFRGLTRLKLLELEYFLENTAGEDVRLIDHEGRTWRGNVLTSPVDLISEAPEDGEAVLEFEGSTVTA